MKLPLSLVVAMSAFCLGGCTPRIEVAASEKPITINMNVKIDHDIHVKADKDVEALLKDCSDLYGQNRADK